jgi:pilus assembly protein CpaB
MNKSVVLIMAGAVLFAFIVAIIVQSKLAPKDHGPVEAGAEILVTTKKLMTGETLKAEDARWQAWPESAAYAGVYKHKDYPDDKSLESVYQLPLRRSLEAGEPITTQALIPDVTKGGSNFIAAQIGPGMRAVAVPVSVERSVGGFLMAGDHVDIILSYNATIPGAAAPYAGRLVSRFATQTILSNVKILAIDQSASNDANAKGDAKGSLKTITVEVNKEGAEILALAIPIGQITLALRKLGEQDTPATTEAPLVTDATELEILQRLNSIVEKTQPQNTERREVRIYSGNAVTRVPVYEPQKPDDSGKAP